PDRERHRRPLLRRLVRAPRRPRRRHFPPRQRLRRPAPLGAERLAGRLRRGVAGHHLHPALSEHRRHTHPVTATDHRPQSGDSDVAGHPRPSPRDRVPPAIRPGPTRPHVHPDGRLPRLRPRPRPGKTRTLARPLHPLLRRRTPRTQTSPTRNLVHPRLPTTRQTNVATSSAFACT